MRWLFLLVCAAGCTGGQTGEITEMTSCTEPTEVALGDAARAEIEAMGEADGALLTWDEDGATTELTVSFAIGTGPVRELGGEGCEHPMLVVPIALRLDTADGRLAEVLLGALERREGFDGAAIRASRLIVDLEGSFDPSFLGPIENDARLVAALTHSEGTTVGQLFVVPGGERDEIQVAAW